MIRRAIVPVAADAAKRKRPVLRDVLYVGVKLSARARKKLGRAKSVKLSSR